MKSLLIANRGEIAVRIALAAAEMELRTVAVYATDDASCLHVRRTDAAVALSGAGPRAYLDIEGVIAAAIESGCDAVHPGYGFLSESAPFATAVDDAGLIFVGPAPATLDRLGNKHAALELARSLDVPVTPGTPAGVDEAALEAFVAAQAGAPVVVKAVAGGGGRGMRVIRSREEVAGALAEASAEALAAFGNGAVYAERYLEGARHIEVQIVGDGQFVSHLWERDCTLQRRHQKLVEISPAPALPEEVRAAMLRAAVAMAEAVEYRGLGTFEFLLEPDGRFAFMEANPRLQVEHTVTEAVTGIDLVQAQLAIARGVTLDELGLAQDCIGAPKGAAVQVRLNLETMTEGGEARPAGGLLSVYEMPGGPGIRVDGHGYAGLRTSAAYDSLLAKIIVHSSRGLAHAQVKAARALNAVRVEGAGTNQNYLRAVLALADLAEGTAHTRWIEAHAAELHERAVALSEDLSGVPEGGAGKQPDGPVLDRTDPLGVLDFGRTASGMPAVEGEASAGADEPGALLAAMQGTILAVETAVGEHVARGELLFVMESMKMQHRITSDHAGLVQRIGPAPGDTVFEGDLLAVIEIAADAGDESAVEEAIDLDYIRPDLEEYHERRALVLDDARPEAVAKRHKLGKRTARENVGQLCDPGSFVEYGDLTYAAQRVRRSVDDLMRNTPADGLVTGFATVNAALFGPRSSRTAVLAYDYTVLAGTQGIMNHIKKDRMVDVVQRQRTPMVFFCEGGGGRPGDVDASDTSIAGLYLTTFYHYARLSGLVPMVGIASGRLFAGNAALLGCCDVIIATRDACIGMGGPAMIEGGGLGVFRPEDVGPTHVQAPNGVIDVLVEDEVEAVEAAKRYLSYFQGAVDEWEAPDPRRLRHVVPENRLEVYDVRAAIEAFADIDSVMELRRDFAPGMVTALARIEGRPVGILANNPVHLSGAIDSPAADKAARFLKLCDAFDIPLVTLIDTPGMMVGPEVEKTALVRHCCRVFLVGANVTVPMVSIVLRKSYGLGAQAMAGGSYRTPLFIVGWPTAEIGGMGLEGAVKLGYRKELEAIEDLDERKALFDEMVAASYERGKAINAASVLEFDTVIDPIDTRRWIASTLDAAPEPRPREGKKRAYVDSW